MQNADPVKPVSRSLLFAPDGHFGRREKNPVEKPGKNMEG